jgi:hypothetical protein
MANVTDYSTHNINFKQVRDLTKLLMKNHS